MFDPSCSQTLLNLSQDGLLVLDLSRGIIGSNEKAKELLGFDPVGRSSKEVLGKEDPCYGGAQEIGSKKLTLKTLSLAGPPEGPEPLKLVVLEHAKEALADARVLAQEATGELVSHIASDPVRLSKLEGAFGLEKGADITTHPCFQPLLDDVRDAFEVIFKGESREDVVQRIYKAHTKYGVEPQMLLEGLEGLEDWMRGKYPESSGVAALREFGRELIQFQYSMLIKTQKGLTEAQEALELTVANQQRAIEEATARIDQECRYWQEIFESSQSGMAVIDLEGRNWEVNKALADILGFSKEEILHPKASWITAIAPYDLPMAKEHLKDLLETGRPQSFELTFLHRSGRKIPTLISYDKLTRRPEWETDRLISSVQDITEFKEAQAQVKKERAYWRMFFDESPIGTAIYDENGRYYGVNEAFCSMAGMTKEELLDPSFDWKTIFSESLERTMEQVRGVMETGKPMTGELVITGKDKRTEVLSTTICLPWQEEDGQQLQAVFHQDISQIKVQQDYVNDLIKLLPTGMFELDLETSQIFSTNPFLQNLLGYTQEELAQKTLFDILSEEFHAEARERIQRALKAGEGSWVNRRLVKKDGGLISVMIAYGKVYDPCIQKDTLAVFVVDVSESERERAFTDKVIEIAPVGFFVADVETGRFLGPNKAFLKMTGYSLEEIQEKSWMDLTPKEMVAREIEENRSLGVKEGAIVRREKEFIRKDGTRMPALLYFGSVYDPRLQKETYAVYVVDITDLKETQQKIERLMSFSQDIIERSVNGIVAVSQDGTVRMANEAAKRLLSLPQDNAGFILDRFEPEKRKEHLSWIADILSKGHGTCHGHETTLKAADGSRLSVLLFHELSRFPEDDTPCVLLFFTDITPLKQAQEKLQELVEAQQRTIKELSTPVIPVWTRVLMAPMMGSFDSQRMHDLSERLLEETARQKPRAVLLDLSGLAYVDTQVVAEVVRLIASVRLLGTQTVLSGINPHTAQSLVRLGTNLEGVPTYATLDQALRGVIGEGSRAGR